MLKVNEYGGRQAKVNEKRQCFKGWETLVNKLSATKKVSFFIAIILSGPSIIMQIENTIH